MEECNRSAYLQIPATHYNHSTREHYCANCAKLINDANHRDAMEMFGHELCTLVEQELTEADCWDGDASDSD